jgi:hypothetical protein
VSADLGAAAGCGTARRDAASSRRCGVARFAAASRRGRRSRATRSRAGPSPDSPDARPPPRGTGWRSRSSRPARARRCGRSRAFARNGAGPYSRSTANFSAAGTLDERKLPVVVEEHEPRLVSPPPFRNHPAVPGLTRTRTRAPTPSGRVERGGSFLPAPPRPAMAFGADQPPEECGDEDGRDRRRDEVGDEGDVGDVCAEGALAGVDGCGECRSDQDAGD